MIEISDEDKEVIRDAFLLTMKKMLYVANVNENQLLDIANDKNVNLVRELAKKENSYCIPLCAKLEEELSELDDEDRISLMKDYGLENSGLDELATKSYQILNLISYLTAGKQEVRAWTITNGTKAPQAAGKIHTDFERGFIKAEVIGYDELMKFGTMHNAKENGAVRMEEKEYVVKDGDIILFKFNV